MIFTGLEPDLVKRSSKHHLDIFSEQLTDKKVDSISEIALESASFNIFPRAECSNKSIVVIVSFIFGVGIFLAVSDSCRVLL